MARPKKLLTAVTTFSVALGIGSIMQYGDAVAARFAPEEQAPRLTESQAETLAALAPTQAGTIAIPVDVDIEAIIGPVEAVIITPPEDEPVRVAAIEDVDAPMFDIPQSVVQADPCEITMSADPASMAMVDLDITAPCHANSALVLHHQGMMFTALTDDIGRLSIRVPALAEMAVFVAAFDDDQGAVVQTTVPDVATVDRAVLQWQGRRGVQLHALEFGATYGETGHINAASLGDLATMESGAGGYMTALGNLRADNPLMAEVYTFPTGIVSRDGDVILTVEAEVTEENCGREVAAQSLQIAPDAPTSAMDLTMTMPGCDAIGEFLVLNNMFEDLTLASR